MTAATPSALAPAPRYQAEPARRQGGVVTVGDWQFPAGLPPTYLPGPAGAELVEQTLFSGLLGIDPDLQLYGDLARAVPTPKLAGGGMDVACELRPGLHWSDGQPINADDVMFTWQVTPRTEGYDQISGIEKTGDLDFTIHFKTVYPAFGLLFPAILPKHRLGGVERARLDGDAYWSAPNVVSGPFMVAESVPADHLTLQRNPRYADGRAEQPLLNHNAYLEKLVFKAFATKGALLSALKAGDVQVALELDESDRVAGARVQSVPALSYEQVTFNQQSAVWRDDPRLLSALADAVDVDGVLAGPLQKRAPAAVGPISPQLDWAFDGDLPPPRFQLDAARAALDADGWTSGSDGVRTKSGKRLQLSLASIAGSPLRQSEAATLAAGWRQAGAEARLEYYSPDQLFGSVLAPGAFDAALFAWDSPPDPDGLFATLHSSRVPPAGANYSRCSSAALDADLAAGRSTLDRARRAAAYRDLQAQYRKLACEVPLYQRLDVGLSSRHLHNYAPDPAGPGNTWNVADWWIDG